MCVRVRVRVCVCVYVCECMCACVNTHRVLCVCVPWFVLVPLAACCEGICYYMRRYASDRQLRDLVYLSLCEPKVQFQSRGD